LSRARFAADYYWETMVLRLQGREIWIEIHGNVQVQIHVADLVNGLRNSCEPELIDASTLRSALSLYVLPLDGEPIPAHWGMIVPPEPALSSEEAMLGGAPDLSKEDLVELRRKDWIKALIAEAMAKARAEAAA
jgi:hypothetical protein